MPDDCRIALLTMLASPLTYPTIIRLKELGISDVAVICEGEEPKKDVVETLKKRTGGNIRFHTKEEIEELGVPFFTAKNVNDEKCMEFIQGISCRLLGNAGIARFIKKPLLEIAPLGIVNCHPGKLPDYRGRTPIEWSLANDSMIAATTHFMVEELDAGPIIRVAPLEIEGLTYSEIRARMLPHQANLLAESLASVLERGEPPALYPDQGEGKVWNAMPESEIDQLYGKRY